MYQGSFIRRSRQIRKVEDREQAENKFCENEIIEVPIWCHQYEYKFDVIFWNKQDFISSLKCVMFCRQVKLGFMSNFHGRSNVTDYATLSSPSNLMDQTDYGPQSKRGGSKSYFLQKSCKFTTRKSFFRTFIDFAFFSTHFRTTRLRSTEAKFMKMFYKIFKRS